MRCNPHWLGISRSGRCPSADNNPRDTSRKRCDRQCWCDLRRRRIPCTSPGLSRLCTCPTRMMSSGSLPKLQISLPNTSSEHSSHHNSSRRDRQCMLYVFSRHRRMCKTQRDMSRTPTPRTRYNVCRCRTRCTLWLDLRKMYRPGTGNSATRPHQHSFQPYNE